MFQRVRPVHEDQVVLLGHHLRAHRLLDAAAPGEGELVPLELGFLRARADVPHAGGAVVAIIGGGDDGVGVAELQLGDTARVAGHPGVNVIACSRNLGTARGEIQT